MWGAPSPQPSSGSERGLWGGKSCFSRCKAPQAVLQGDLSRSSRARMCVSASQRNLCSCFLFVCLFFLRLMHTARVPLLQLFCDTAQPSNVGSPARRAAVTASPVQAGQVPNLLFIPESSAE